LVADGESPDEAAWPADDGFDELLGAALAAGVPPPEAWAPWRRALVPLFGEATLAQAEALLAGEQRFFGIVAPGEDFAGCALHARLLDAFARVAGAGGRCQ
jgi:hypothetical protein